MSSRQPKLFQRAAECARLMNLSSDPIQKQTFRQLRDMWIALANDCLGLSSDAITKEIASMDEIQSAAGERNWMIHG
jgi:hypothetical protein